jgi:hypothetical protein
MQPDLKEKVLYLIVNQLQSRGRSDVVELETDLLTLGIDSLLIEVRSVKEVISVCEQLVSARMDNR